MNITRVPGFLVLVLTLVSASLTSEVAAQDSDFACEDFLTQTSAQSYLEGDPTDPYGLDPDGDGIACEEMLAAGEPEPGAAPDANFADEDRLPLDARLGGTIESWEEAFGSPVERDGEAADLFTEYDIPDFSTVFADEHLGRIETISLFAPRPADEEWTDAPHEMNWSVAEAHEIAVGFLPRDARVDETLDEEAFGFVHTFCTSESLTNQVPQEIYDYVDDTPQYGRCSYSLWYANFEPGDQISRISISLEIDEPPDSNGDSADTVAGAGAPSGEVGQTANDDAQFGFSVEERAYIDEMEQITTTVGDSLIRAGELFQDPRPLDEDWLFEAVLQLSTWQSSYEAALEVDAPPAFADIHSLYIEALRLIAEAADDIAAGMDSGDVSRLDQAGLKIEEANGLIDLATVQIEELVAERGG